jgi:hypothetical protein
MLEVFVELPLLILFVKDYNLFLYIFQFKFRILNQSPLKRLFQNTLP